jgi:hypothetical protein
VKAIQSAEEARNLAVRIVSDIALYSANKVKEGILKDTLFDVLKDELEEGRTFYEQNVPPELLRRTNYFNWAVADILVKPNANLKSRLW